MTTALKPARRFRLSLSTKRAITGLLFILPFLIGFVLFFVSPFIQSIVFSVSEMEVTPSGYSLHYVGLENFHYVVAVHPQFVRAFVETIGRTLIDIPAVIIFSFFMAVLLNQRFRGRLLARIIFFLPIIFAAPIILELEAADGMFQMMASGEMAETVMEVDLTAFSRIYMFFLSLRLPEILVQYVIQAVIHLPDIVYASAIPILIFLAALQSIPRSLYECSAMEGATGWESFWKITFPLLTPMFLTNVVYIIVDSFTSHNNELIQLIRDEAWGASGYTVSVAMSWFYFAAIVVILGITVTVISRRVFYM